MAAAARFIAERNENQLIRLLEVVIVIFPLRKSRCRSMRTISFVLT